jgi:hypothetical protein
MIHELPKVRPDQAEALVRLLAKATKAGFLPSAADTFCLLDLIDGHVSSLEVQPKVETCEGGER